MNLENEKLLLAQAQSSTGSEVEKLKYELSQVESEKRDLLAVVGRLHSDDKQMEEEVQSLRSNLKQVRGEYQELQSQLADLKSSDTHMKFKIQTLEQQLDHAQSSSKSYSEEVATKSEEFSKFRREKHAEIVSLQSSLDSLNTAYSGVQATLQSVQETYGRQNQQLTQATQKVSQLEAQLADQAASFRSESANQERLIELLERRNEQARTRVQEVESEWETMVKTAEERESSLVADLERQKKRGDQLEAVVEELRAEKERAAEGELALLNEETTPGVNRDRGFFTLSPAAGVAARLQKSGKTFTEVYTDYVRIQGELAGSQSEARRLQDLLSQVLADIEERSPVLAQQRQDFERIKAEAEVLTGQLTQTLSERDQYSRRVADLEKQLQSERLMIAELEQSGADLGRQVTNLTRRIAIMENPSLEDIPMLPVAPAEALSADLALSTDQVVLFENLPSLQAQNQKLLRISHSLALAFDRREQELRQGLEREESEAIREANDAIALLEDQIESQSRSHQMRINALAKELEIAKMAAPQQSGALLPPVNGTESQLQTDMQDHFEAYRLELGIDASRLREDLAKSQHELNQKAADLAKANGTIQFLNERQRMMQDEQQLKTREIEALNRRIQDLRDQHTKLELTYSQTADNATHAHSIAERLRTECANLRAEQEIWKSIESRLTSENRVLAKERSQFADLANNIQKMHHDLEMSGQSDRRRMEGQIQSMDLQLQDLRAQVTREREISRNLSLQKDVETRELHLRLDQTTSDLGSAKQSLIKVEADYSHAKARIDELLKEVETAREKLSVYERHPGADVAPLQRHEHELRAEAAQLSADFKQTQQALTAALAHVEQYKSISESNERAFQELTATFDELKKSAQEKLEGKEAEVKSLLQKLNDQQVHTTSLNERIADLDKTLATERLAFKEEQRNLETQIVNLSTSAANSETDSASRDNELRSLEQRAKTSEQKYEDEIKAHAESIKAADLLKQELVQAQAVIRDIQTKADAAEANLATSEASWRNQRAALDKEMADLTKRCQELTGQNERLHAHLESVSAQASRIRQAADAPVDQTDASNGVDDKLSDLRAVVSYLRKEKEIVDLHLEVSREQDGSLRRARTCRAVGYLCC
ncbi:hypothetical protein SISNIDRAFT_104297 [Sistotremastrum niveocremeum HHB9708]|uniref:Uncharacterized protein n=1 Tax=Sistotremastrum niveocremeum HHB9708 TaxID=1314777 RepID=A0A164UGK6_9AGAM|nr:hypothetical protein SISNIDRAFT_104297 [Sistotremastrum niveocremeum HHB9708]